MKMYYLLGLLAIISCLNQPVSYSVMEWKKHVSEINNKEKACEECNELDLGVELNKVEFNTSQESVSTKADTGIKIERIQVLGSRRNSLTVKTLSLIDEIEDLLSKVHRESCEAARTSMFFLEKKFKAIYTVLGEIDAINTILNSGQFSDEDLVAFGIKDTQKELNELKNRVDLSKKEFIKLKKIRKRSQML